MHVSVSKKALESIDLAVSFYEGIRPELGHSFQKAVALAFKSLRQFSSYAIRYDDVRIYRLRKFPYTIHFVRREDENHIEVLQVLHERQASGLDFFE